MRFIKIDFETRSKISIKAGASRYSLNAEVMCLAYSLDGGMTTQLWHPGLPNPQDLFDAIASGLPVYAHNATFEICIWRNVMVAKHGWPKIDDKAWRCTMAEALAAGLPSGLEKIAEGMGLPVKKDMKGRRTVLKMSKPRRPTKKDKSEWHEKPEDKAILYDYCKQDVAAEIAVFHAVPRLSDREIQVYHYDQKVNRRGIMFDRELAESAIEIWGEHCRSLNAELSLLTDGRVKTSRELKNMQAVLEEEGVEVFAGLTKGAVADYLGDELTAKARRILEIRQELALSSVSKYEAMLRCMEPDDRVRGCTQYHVAQPGRWGGRLVQVQNFPRGVLEAFEIERLVSLVKRRDIKALKMLMPIGDVLSSLLRSAIIPAPGKKLVVCDFAAIEARGLAWAAGEKWLIDAFAKGDDVYKAMASDIYHVPIKEITKDQRFYGKTCLGAETRVLTSNGVKCIVDVTTDDLLWDGLEWVSHAGLLYQGEQEALTANGLTATADHEVLTQTGWQEWGTVLTDPQSILSAVKSVNLPSSLTNGSTGHSAQYANVRAGGKGQSIAETWIKVELPVAKAAEGRRVTLNNTGNTNSSCQMMRTEHVCSTDYPRPFQGATIQKTGYSPAMAVEASSLVTRGGTIRGIFSDTYKLLRVGIFQNWKWTGRITTKGTNPETFNSSRDNKTSITGDSRITLVAKSSNCVSGSKNSNTKIPVYDLGNAGPRHRFTVVTDAGYMIVSNCILGCGYSMGSSKFQASLAGFGVNATFDFCEKVVKAYRAKNPNIVRFWYATQEAAIKAIKLGGAHASGPFTFCVKGDWLWCKLPNGRRIGYYKPILEPGKYGPQIGYLGVDTRGKLVKTSTYGGKLVENCIQAICRDILVEALSRLEKADYPVVMHVHDEAVSEVDASFGSAREMEEIMSVTPGWCKGFPIDAEGFECTRYRK